MTKKSKPPCEQKGAHGLCPHVRPPAERWICGLECEDEDVPPMKSKQRKFHPWWLLRMQMCEGEREHYTYVPLEVVSKQDLESRADAICREQYGEPTDVADGTYEFDDGAVMVYVDEAIKVTTLAEYKALKKYL